MTRINAIGAYKSMCPVNFKGNNADVGIMDNKPVEDKKMSKSAKVIIGASALAVAVAGIILLRKGKAPNVESVADNINPAVQNVKKSVHDMNEKQLAEWSETQILKIQNLFNKKRDLTNWNNAYNAERPYDAVRFRSNDSFGQCSAENGYLYIERIDSKFGRHLIKSYTEDGHLDSIMYSSGEQWIKIHKKADGKGFFAEYVDRTASTHKNPVATLDISLSDEGLKYKTSLRHHVRSEQYYPREYANANESTLKSYNEMV